MIEQSVTKCEIKRYKKKGTMKIHFKINMSLRVTKLRISAILDCLHQRKDH
jgi:hypothetical protein